MSEPSIEVADGFDIPTVEVLTGRGACFGKSGSGKSNSASVVVEEVLDQGHAVLIIDVDGEYYGLKEQYEMLHAAGDQEGDLQVGAEHAEQLATVALEQNVPVILDVSSFFDPEEADELIANVAKHLFVRAKKLKKPFLIVVEECHEYLPEQGKGGEAAKALTRVGKRGRKHGLGMLGVSQRPADVSKDYVTQANWISWHRLTYKNDTKVVSGMYGAEHAGAVEDLDDGEALFVADWLDAIERVQWRRKRTYDAGATPGLDDTETPELRSIDEGVIESLEQAGDRARSKADRIEYLEEQLADREDRIEELEQDLEEAKEWNAMEERLADRFDEAFGSALGEDFEISLSGEGSIRAEVMEVVQQKQELEGELADARERAETLEAELAEKESTIEELREYREQVERQQEVHEALADLQELVTDRYPDLFGVGADERTERLRREIERLEEEREELADRVERFESGGGAPAASEEFESMIAKIETDAVQDAVDKAAENTKSTRENVLKTFLAVARADGQVHASEILGVVPFKTDTQTGRVLKALYEEGLLERHEGERGRYEYSVNEETIDHLLRQAAEDEELAAIADRIGSGR